MKLYLMLFGLTILWLVFKTKTKKPKYTNPDYNPSTPSYWGPPKNGNMGDLATWFLFSELTRGNRANSNSMAATYRTESSQFDATSQLSKSRGINQVRVPLNQYKTGGKIKRKKFGVRVRNTIASSQGWKCTICQKLLPAGWELDHKKPLHNGGKDEINNLQALCCTCHSAKTYREGISAGF